MATLSFWAGQSPLQDVGTSGLGLFGSAGFGAAVVVGAFQDKTYVTNSVGTLQGPEAWNTKYANLGSGYLAGGSSPTGLLYIPNYQSTLNVRFTHSASVQTQNAKMRVYDYVNINNNPSGATFYAAEIIHPETSQAVIGSGDIAWINLYGSGSIMDLAPCPGISGLYAGNGSNSTLSSVQHDWYAVITGSPDTIGSKTNGLYVQVEYL